MKPDMRASDQDSETNEKPAETSDASTDKGETSENNDGAGGSSASGEVPPGA